MTGRMHATWGLWPLLCVAPLPSSADIFVNYATDGTPTYSTTRSGRNQVPILFSPRSAARGTLTAGDTPAIALQPETEALIRSTCARHGVDVALIKAIIAVESHFRTTAQSPKGAIGLMQLMPATARQYGVTDPTDPGQNIEAGVRHIKALIAEHQGNLALALAAYNAGTRSILRSGKRIPPYRETMDYVPLVLARYALFRREEE